MLNENIAQIFANLIKAGLRTVESVPAEIRPYVEEIIKESREG